MMKRSGVVTGLLVFCASALLLYVAVGEAPGDALVYGGAFGLAFALTWCLARDRWWRGMAISRRACFLFYLALWGVMVCGVLDGLSGYRGEMLLTEGQSRQ